MVDPVKFLPLFAFFLASHAGADMADPTRPPSGFSQAAAGEKTATTGEEEAPLLVNSVFLMGTKPYALVDGMLVHVGDKLGSGQVSRIDESGVWLKTRTGSRLLRLVSGIDKKAVNKNAAQQPAPQAAFRATPSPDKARMEKK